MKFFLGVVSFVMSSSLLQGVEHKIFEDLFVAYDFSYQVTGKTPVWHKLYGNFFVPVWFYRFFIPEEFSHRKDDQVYELGRFELYKLQGAILQQKFMTEERMYNLIRRMVVEHNAGSSFQIAIWVIRHTQIISHISLSMLVDILKRGDNLLFWVLCCAQKPLLVDDVSVDDVFKVTQNSVEGNTLKIMLHNESESSLATICEMITQLEL